MTMKGFVLRYGWIVGLREWARCNRIRPEVRVGTTAVAGAVIAPFVMFVAPVARLYWLITGRRLPRPFDCLTPRPYVLVDPFPDHHPPEIRELLERPAGPVFEFERVSVGDIASQASSGADAHRQPVARQARGWRSAKEWTRSVATTSAGRWWAEAR